MTTSSTKTALGRPKTSKLSFLFLGLLRGGFCGRLGSRTGCRRGHSRPNFMLGARRHGHGSQLRHSVCPAVTAIATGFTPTKTLFAINSAVFGGLERHFANFGAIRTDSLIHHSVATLLLSRLLLSNRRLLLGRHFWRMVVARGCA